MGSEMCIRDRAYAERHPDAGYIRIVAQPKLEKLGKAFAAQLRG